MLKRGPTFFLVLTLLALLFLPAAAAAQTTTCRLNFELHGWSLAVKHATGRGTISCDNGQTADVVIRVRGGGLSAGKYAVHDGHGTFSPVNDVRELFGSYAATDASAGMVKEREALAMTKGSVNLALSGKGTGFDLGVAVEKFTIRPASERGHGED